MDITPEIPVDIKKYYSLCSIKLGVKKHPIVPANIEHARELLGRKYFNIFFKVENVLIPKESIIGAGQRIKKITIY